MIIRKILLMTSIVMFLFSSAGLMAQEEMDYSWGVVLEITETRLILHEYDFDTEEYISVVYEIDPEVELENVESLIDIQKDNEVEVGFVERGGKKVVLSLYLEKQMPDMDMEE